MIAEATKAAWLCDRRRVHISLIISLTWSVVDCRTLCASIQQISPRVKGMILYRKRYSMSWALYPVSCFHVTQLLLRGSKLNWTIIVLYLIHYYKLLEKCCSHLEVICYSACFSIFQTVTSAVMPDNFETALRMWYFDSL